MEMKGILFGILRASKKLLNNNGVMKHWDIVSVIDSLLKA